MERRKPDEQAHLWCEICRGERVTLGGREAPSRGEGQALPVRGTGVLIVAHLMKIGNNSFGVPFLHKRSCVSI